MLVIEKLREYEARQMRAPALRRELRGEVRGNGGVKLVGGVGGLDWREGVEGGGYL